MRKNITSPLLLLLAAMIWGFAFAAQAAASSVPAFTLGAARSFVAAIFLIFVIIFMDSCFKNGRKLFSKRGIDLNRYEIIGGVILGVILAAASAFQQIGINKGTDGGKAAFITALYVVLVPIYALAMKKKAPINVWISVGISVVGFYLLCITEELSIARSDLFVLISSLIFPIHILTIDVFSPKCDGVRMSAVQFFTCAAVNALIALFTEMPLDMELVVSCLPHIIYLGVASSGIAYTLQIIGQKGVQPAAASIILSLESVFGVIGTALFLKERLSAREYVGCAVVLIAVILSQLDFKTIKIRSDKKGEENEEIH